MGTELEGGNHSEVTSASAQGPEQIVIFVGACREHLAVGGHGFEGQHVVDRHTEFSHQPSNAAAEREAGNSRS